MHGRMIMAPRSGAFCLLAVTMGTGPIALAAQETCLPAMPQAHAPLLAEHLRAREAASLPPFGRFLVRASDDFARCGPRELDLALAAGPISIAIAPTAGGLTYNSGYADDRNNGALWSGRGASAGVQTGLVLRAGPLTAGFQPILAYQQNGDFGVNAHRATGYSEYANSIHPTTIDLPHRFGAEAFTTLDVAGQSFVRLDAYGFAVGLAHENYWVGPAIRNPILMSNTAAAFGHAFLGTSRPLDAWIAKIEFDVVVGRTAESDYLDSNPQNDRADIAMWVLGVRPRWLEGLEVGVSRVLHYQTPLSRWYGEPGHLREFFFAGGNRNVGGNELASFFGRWVFPESGAEIYGEWARDDTYATLTDDLIPEPDHSQAYMLGFQKVTTVGPRAVRLHAELSHLQEKQETRAGRPLPVYYTHSQVGVGYTHLGQLMGSSIGPGADSQYLSADLMERWGFAGLFVERIRRYEGSRQSVQARFTFPFDHDTELAAGVRGLYFWRDLAVGGTLSYAKRWSREFFEDDTNVRLVTEVSWRPLGVSATESQRD